MDESLDLLDKLDAWTTSQNGRSVISVPDLGSINTTAVSSNSSVRSYRVPSHHQRRKFELEYMAKTTPRILTVDKSNNQHALTHTNLVQKRLREDIGPDPVEVLERLQAHEKRLKQQSDSLSSLIVRHDFYDDFEAIRSKPGSPEAVMREIRGARAWGGRKLEGVNLGGREGTREYFRGSKRGSIVGPMVSLEKSVVIDESRNELFSPPPPRGGGWQANRGGGLPDLRGDDGASGLPIDLPTRGERAVRDFIVSKRASAFRKDLDLNVMRQTFCRWKGETKRAEKAKDLMISGEAHWEIAKGAKALKTWRIWAKLSAWRRKLDLKSKT